MSRDYEPQAGQWYEDLDNEEAFQVLSVDPDEEIIYPAIGTDRHVFTAGPLTFGIVICHEGWRYPETVRWAARRGAQIVFHPHASIAQPGSYRPLKFADPVNTFHEKAMLCRAAENTCYFASVNCASEGSGTTSAIAGPDGTLLCHQPYGVEGVLIARDIAVMLHAAKRQHRHLDAGKTTFAASLGLGLNSDHRTFASWFPHSMAPN